MAPEDFEAFFAEVRAFYESPRRHISVTDIQLSAKVSTAFLRRDAAAFMKELNAASAQWCAGSAIIVPSSVLAGAIRAVFWVSPPAFPYAVLSDREEAEAWLRQQAERLDAPTDDAA
jgi:hypothetical protein